MSTSQMLNMQAVWSQLWQLVIAMLGIAMLMLALQNDRGKLPVHQTSQQKPACNGNHPGKLQ